MWNIVLIGAGGTGMSGLTMLLDQLGYTNLVAINDVDNQLTARLHDRNIKVIIGHGRYQIQKDDFVIYSDVPAIITWPEVSQSRLYQQEPTKKHFHVCISYNQMIAEISKHFITIAVAGSNGKSSTTGMLMHILNLIPNPSPLREGWPQDKTLTIGKSVDLLSFAKKLRNQSTPTEEYLRQHLKNRQLDSMKFRRQHPVGRYIADFYCAEYGLIIELDGWYHTTIPQQEYDTIRDEDIERKWFHTLRFTNKEVDNNIKNVLQKIIEFKNNTKKTIQDHIGSYPSPSGRGNEGEVFALGIVGALMPQYDNQWYLINKDILPDIRHLFDHIVNQKHQLNYDLLKKYLFVIEACEYKNHFLSYDIDYSLITNIQHDHIDFFPTEESYITAFHHLISQTKKKVILTPSATEIFTQSRLDHFATEKHIISEPYPFNSDYLIGSYHQSNAGMVLSLVDTIKNMGFSSLTREVSDRTEGLLTTKNSLLSIFESRKWLGRRMELITKTPSQAKVYSDYSHHAPAILGNLQALRKQFPENHIITIFQPHQAQRVLAGRDDFTHALVLSDETVIYKLYTAREDFDVLQKTYPQLADRQSFDELGEKFAEHVGGRYITAVDDIINLIQKEYPTPTSIVIFSAGDLDYQVRRKLSTSY